MFDLFRHRRLTLPGGEPHLGFRHRIVGVPAVSARRSTVEGPIHHTVFLGAPYKRDVPEEDVMLLWQFTIKGEDITLDCCSYSLGMHGCIDASTLIKGFPEIFTISGFSRIPAYFHTPQDGGRHPYALVEESRFSVMHNENLRQAYIWRPLQPAEAQVLINSISTLQVNLVNSSNTREYAVIGSGLVI